jgi:lactoylglutathione lyase
MLGIWSIDTIPIGMRLHVAFEIEDINDLLSAPQQLKAKGIMPLSFFGTESMEPSVIGWMPAAAIYFKDPDDHLIEYLTMLDDNIRRQDLGVVSWSEWLSQKGKS